MYTSSKFMKITYRTILDLELNNLTKSIDKPVALLHIKDGKLFQKCSIYLKFYVYILSMKIKL